MAMLDVKNVPEELYEARRGRAQSRRRSIAAEVLALLEANIPTQRELKARRKFLRRACDLQSKNSAGRGAAAQRKK
jgi:plasmid stability protein